MNTASPMSLVNIFVEPKTVFDNLRANKKWSFVALLIILSVTAVSSMMFFNGMSQEWLIEQQLLGMGDVSPAEMENARQGIAMVAEHTGTIAAVGSLIMLPLIMCVFALYFKIIGATAASHKTDFSFGDWFSFSIWTQMPALVNTLGFIILFATSASGDLPISMPNYASINQLFIGSMPGEALYNWAEALNLFLLWSAFIAAVGFNRCCKMSVVKSAIYALLPIVFVFGAWFLLI